LMWLAIGLGGLIFRTVHLFFLKDVQTGLVWMTKILTDPFHDVMLYYRAPLHPLRRELSDPMPPAPPGENAPLKDTAAPRERGSIGGCARHCAPRRYPKWAIISRRIWRLMGRGRGSDHHQPSHCMALAAATKRSATAAKSCSV